MNTHEDDRIKTVFDRVVARTPEVGAPPQHADPGDRFDSTPRRLLLGAAVAIAIVGVAGLAQLTGDDATTAPAAGTSVAPMAPTTTLAGVAAPTIAPVDEALVSDPIPVRPGGPPLLPVVKDSIVGDRAVTAILRHTGASVQPQTRAVIATIEADGSTTDLYTFLAGPGAEETGDQIGLSFDSDTPNITRDELGYGYASWTIDETPILVLAVDPATLLNGDGFSLEATTNEAGDVDLQFSSLPAGFVAIAAPDVLDRQAADALLVVGADDFSVISSLDNPLANINLTEGTTLTLARIGDRLGWLVESPGGSYRAVVWSPDNVTWVSVGADGESDDVIGVARQLTFTDDVGEWMSRYDVELPAIDFDSSTTDG